MHRPSYVPTTASLPFWQKLAAVIRLVPRMKVMHGEGLY